MQYLADIEEHLGVTIDQVDISLKIATDEFDGKVTYGQKRSNAGEKHFLLFIDVLYCFAVVRILIQE